MVSRFLGGGSAYLSNGSSGFRKEEEEESNACEEEENEKRELEGRNPINLFIKRFSCLCRRGLSRSHGKYEALKRVLPNPAREGIATIPTGYRRINEGSLP